MQDEIHRLSVQTSPAGINPLYRIMQEQYFVFSIIILPYLLICQVNKL